MPIVAGMDSSPSTTRVVVCDALSGKVMRKAAVAHAAAGDDDPHEWWNALVKACDGDILDGVQAVAVSGQRQALVCLDSAGGVVRPALLSSDYRAANSADDLVAEGGGPGAWAAAVGSVPTAAFPIAKLRWLAQREPENAARVAAALQPHDWLTWLLLGGGAGPVTDRGEASGTGYWSPFSGDYRMALMAHAFGRELAVPRVLGPVEPAGTTPAGVLVAPGTGSAMAQVLGLSAEPGDVVISIGATGTLFAGGLPHPVSDPAGAVSGFADAGGRFLAMTRTGEAMPTLEAAAKMMSVDLQTLSRLALESTPGAQGVVLVPPAAGHPGSLTGLRLARMTAPNLARAAVEGLLCGLADGLDTLAERMTAVGTPVRRVILTGKGARLDAVRLIAPAIFGVPVAVAVSASSEDGAGGGLTSTGVFAALDATGVPRPGSGRPTASAMLGGSEIMAIGAARQAAWVLAASTAPAGEAPAAPPTWNEAVMFKDSPNAKSGIGIGVRAQFAGAREAALASMEGAVPVPSMPSMPSMPSGSGER